MKGGKFSREMLSLEKRISNREHHPEKKLGKGSYLSQQRRREKIRCYRSGVRAGRCPHWVQLWVRAKGKFPSRREKRKPKALHHFDKLEEGGHKLMREESYVVKTGMKPPAWGAQTAEGRRE